MAIHGWDISALEAYVNAPVSPPPPAPPSPAVVVPGVYSFGTRAISAFGCNAPAYATLPPTVQAVYTNNWDGQTGTVAKTTAVPNIGQNSLAQALAAASTFYLDRSAPDVVAGTWVLVSAGASAQSTRLIG